MEAIRPTRELYTPNHENNVNINVIMAISVIIQLNFVQCCFNSVQ